MPALVRNPAKLAGVSQLSQWQPTGEGGDTTLTQLFTILRQSVSLVVLGNVESILRGDRYARQYHPATKPMGKKANASARPIIDPPCCSPDTRRRKRWCGWSGKSNVVRILPLAGLFTSGLVWRFCVGEVALSMNANQQVVERYSGNPLALMLVADTIHDLFAGDADAFLHEDAAIFDDINDVLDQQSSGLLRWNRIFCFGWQSKTSRLG